MERSNSTKVRNKLNELSHIESALYKKYFLCLQNNLNTKDYINCKGNLSKEVNIMKTMINNNSKINALCLTKCNDLLNFPSEELTCYDKCEEQYSMSLSSVIEKLIQG